MIVSRLRSLDDRAHRMALYKVIRQAGAAQTLHVRTSSGARCERRHATTTAEGAGGAAVFDRTNDNVVPARSPGAPAPGADSPWSNAATTAGLNKSHRGERTAKRSAMPGVCAGGAQVASWLGARACTDLPTVRPDSWDFGPTPRPWKGLPIMAMTHWREATWRILDNPITTRFLSVASARCSLACLS